MTRARLLVALLLLLALAPSSGSAAACAGPSIQLTSVPALVTPSRSVVVRGKVYGATCVPEQRAPVTLRVFRPSAPGTDWARVTRTDWHGRFSFGIRLQEPGVRMTLAAPVLDKGLGSVPVVATATVGPLVMAHPVRLSGPRRTTSGKPLRLLMRTTEGGCTPASATYTVQTRPAGGAWGAGTVVACTGRLSRVGTISAPVNPGPQAFKDFELRVVRETASAHQATTVSPLHKLRVH